MSAVEALSLTVTIHLTDTMLRAHKGCPKITSRAAPVKILFPFF